jgi:hypothetical protein
LIVFAVIDFDEGGTASIDLPHDGQMKREWGEALNTGKENPKTHVED